MSYGARIYNESGGILIDSEFPSMVADETGTLDSWRGQNDLGEWVFDMERETQYHFTPQGGEPPNPNPIFLSSDDISTKPEYEDTLLFIKLEVGSHFWFGFVSWGKTADKAAFGVLSNELHLEYALVRPRSTMPAPSGYGMALFNEAGECTWDSNYALGYIDGASPFLAEYSILTHRTGSLWVCMPALPGSAYDQSQYTHNRSIMTQPRIHRVSSSEIKVQRVHQKILTNNGGQFASPIGTPVLTGRF